MNGFAAFAKKEFLESVRGFKLLIMLLIFLTFGVISPLFAKLTPDILTSVMPEGVTVTLPAPTAFDAWMQFFKNTTQMGIIVTVIIFSGTMSGELSKGTLIILLTKGLPRSAVIIAKTVCITFIWTLSLVTAFVVAWLYTEFLFVTDGIENLLFAVFCLWLFGIFMLALLVFAASAVKNAYGCLLVIGIVFTAGMLVNIVPDAYRFNPLSLASLNMDIITGAVAVTDVVPAVWMAAALSFMFLTGAVLTFKRKQL
jgi:ABC-2 type transport system permease protein